MPPQDFVNIALANIGKDPVSHNQNMKQN